MEHIINRGSKKEFVKALKEKAFLTSYEIEMLFDIDFTERIECKRRCPKGYRMIEAETYDTERYVKLTRGYITTIDNSVQPEAIDSQFTFEIYENDDDNRYEYTLSRVI